MLLCVGYMRQTNKSPDKSALQCSFGRKTKKDPNNCDLMSVECNSDPKREILFNQGSVKSKCIKKEELL